MTEEPVLSSDGAADRYQRQVLQEIRAVGVEPVTVGVYGLLGGRARTVVVLQCRGDVERVVALGRGWSVRLSRWAA